MHRTWLETSGTRESPVWNYEDGEAVSTDGSWEADMDIAGVGALAVAGILIKAEPQAGDIYLQEIYPEVAEDTAQIHALWMYFLPLLMAIR